MDVKFYTKGGRQMNHLQIYKDIDELNKISGYSEDAVRKTYSMAQNEELNNLSLERKNNRSKSGSKNKGSLVPNSHGQIEIAGVTLEPEDVAKLTTILSANHQA